MCSQSWQVLRVQATNFCRALTWRFLSLDEKRSSGGRPFRDQLSSITKSLLVDALQVEKRKEEKARLVQTL